MNTRLEQMINIAEYLQDEDGLMVLESLQDRKGKGQFLLPVIGQFSSGKSRLINNLLGKEILPTKGTETTAFTTYISGGDEQVRVESVTGEMIEIDFARLALLDQVHLNYQTVQQVLGIHEQLEIKAIHVQMRASLLKNGLIFVDTPGLNTVFKAHEDITYSVLPQAQCLIYVIGKSVSQIDLRILEQINKMGIKIIYVRTRLDSIKHSEEEIDDALQKDRQLLQQLEQNEVHFFGISNDFKDEINEKYVSKFNDLYQFIHDQIVMQIPNVWEECLPQQLDVLASCFQNKLKDKLKLLESIQNVDQDERVKQIKFLSRKMHLFERNYQHTAKNTLNAIQEVNNNISRRLRKESKEILTKFKQEIIEISDLEEMNRFTERVCRNYIVCIKSKAEEELKNGIQLMHDLSQNALQKSIELSEEVEEFDPRFDIVQPDQKMTEGTMTTQLNFLYRKKDEANERLEKQNEELKELEAMKEYMEQQCAECKEKVAIARDEIAAYGEYIPKTKILEGTHMGEQTGKKLGKIADLMLLLWPGSAVTKRATSLMKNIGHMDKIRDTAYLVKKVGQHINHKIPDTGILDYITIEYWFGMIGKKFDTPAREAIDLKYEVLYRNKKSELEEKYRKAANEMLNKMEKLGIILSAEERIRKLMVIEEENVVRVEKELAMEKEKMNLEAQKEITLNHAVALERQFIEFTQKYIEHVQERLDRLFTELADRVIQLRTAEIQKQLETNKKLLEEAEGEKTHQEIVQQINQIKEYLMKVS